MLVRPVGHCYAQMPLLIKPDLAELEHAGGIARRDFRNDETRHGVADE
jgi:hypothetical protein